MFMYQSFSTALLLLIILFSQVAVANELKIQTLTEEGDLLFKSIPNVDHYQIEKSDTPNGSWNDASSNLNQIGIGCVTCKVDTVSSSMFFRVTAQEIPVPAGQALIHGGNNTGTNTLGTGETHDWTYPKNYALSVESFNMDLCEVTNEEVIQLFQWAYDQGKISAHDAGVTNSQGLL